MNSDNKTHFSHRGGNSPYISHTISFEAGREWGEQPSQEPGGWRPGKAGDGVKEGEGGISFVLSTKPGSSWFERTRGTRQYKRPRERGSWGRPSTTLPPKVILGTYRTVYPPQMRANLPSFLLSLVDFISAGFLRLHCIYSMVCSWRGFGEGAWSLMLKVDTVMLCYSPGGDWCLKPVAFLLQMSPAVQVHQSVFTAASSQCRHQLSMWRTDLWVIASCYPKVPYRALHRDTWNLIEDIFYQTLEYRTVSTYYDK